jgi:hypothetical protein
MSVQTGCSGSLMSALRSACRIEHRVFPHITQACQGVIFHSREIARQFIEPANTTTGLSVTVGVLDKVYETGRKYAEDFKTTMKIVFDDHLRKWNYRALPQNSYKRGNSASFRENRGSHNTLFTRKIAIPPFSRRERPPRAALHEHNMRRVFDSVAYPTLEMSAKIALNGRTSFESPQRRSRLLLGTLTY